MNCATKSEVENAGVIDGSFVTSGDTSTAVLASWGSCSSSPNQSPVRNQIAGAEASNRSLAPAESGLLPSQSNESPASSKPLSGVRPATVSMGLHNNLGSCNEWCS